MQICDKQYQSLNISASPSFATAQGRENERRDWTEETYLAKNKQPGNRYDWSRKHLNFEIKRGHTMIMKNGQTHYIKPRIIPLGSQRKTLKQRYEQRLKELDYKPWTKDAPNQPNTCVDFVISGDHDRMTEIAFGNPMDLDWQEDNGNVTLADDPNCRGRKQIETMALDYYDFLCRKFGEENVITNCPRRKTMRTNCFSPSDVIRWPRLCMHQSIGSGDNRTNVAIEFRIKCLWMLGE